MLHYGQGLDWFCFRHFTLQTFPSNLIKVWCLGFLVRIRRRSRFRSFAMGILVRLGICSTAQLLLSGFSSSALARVIYFFSKSNINENAQKELWVNHHNPTFILISTPLPLQHMVQRVPFSVFFLLGETTNLLKSIKI